jgi:diaminohydroxyphosphoribosylaminopyrimidine deaminase / 5-amino-6-(5-phosphoribosylamino)uracil reductase
MTDLNYMKYALELAASAKGKTNPNPLVGAVLVKEGRTLRRRSVVRAWTRWQMQSSSTR